MGSINSRPKAPSVQPYTASTQVPVSTPTSSERTEEEVATEARQESLLRRSRGKFGTILTSFRGFLDAKQGADVPIRKTLLGE